MEIKQLLGDRVLIKPDIEKDLCINGIYIPQTAQEGPSTGLVEAIGPDVEGIKVGEYVIFPFNVKNSRQNYFEFVDEGEKHVIIHAFDVVAVITE